MARPSSRERSTRAAATGDGESLASRPSDEVGRTRASPRTLEAQNAVLRQVVAIHDRLAGLVLQGADVNAITDALAEMIEHPVLVLDPLLQPGGTSRAAGLDWNPAEAYVSRALGALAGERRPLRIPSLPAWGVNQACILAPIGTGDSLLGYLAILESAGGERGEEVDLLAAQHAATVYALAMTRERMARDVAQRLRDELVEGLLTGQLSDARAAQERAFYLGYDPRLPYRVVVFALQVAEARTRQVDLSSSVAARRRILDGLVEVVARRVPGGILAVRQDQVLLLQPEPASSTPSGPTAAQVGRLAVQYARTTSAAWGFTVGIGGVADTASTLVRSYHEAKLAVETARRLGRGGDVMAFADLGLFRLLHQVPDPAELTRFLHEVLGSLLDYDCRHNTELVRTLSCYLNHNGSQQATAQELTLHVNSVSYRLRRIQAITGLNFQSADDRLLALVALRIRDGMDAG